MSDPNTEISKDSGHQGSRTGTPTQKVVAASLLLLAAIGWFFLHNNNQSRPLDTPAVEQTSVPPDQPSDPPQQSEQLQEEGTSSVQTESQVNNPADNQQPGMTDPDIGVKTPAEADDKNNKTKEETSSQNTSETLTVIDRETAAANAEISPSFDIVTVSPEGETVLAGRAEPGATVNIHVNGESIGSTTADSNGEWVFVPDSPLTKGLRELDLVAKNKSGAEVYSEKIVVVILPESGTVAEKITTGKSVGPVTVLMSRDGEGLDLLLQGKELAEGLIGGEELTLDILNYNPKGHVDFSGKGRPDGEIRAYLNNQLIGIAKVNPDGTWKLIPDQRLEAGLHTLRIDQLDIAGTVISRLETPFSMASFERPKAGEGLVVVQPGNSLWRIARRLYGAGIRYTMIFVANQEQIKDPSLIYPGQIFVVPEDG